MGRTRTFIAAIAVAATTALLTATAANAAFVPGARYDGLAAKGPIRQSARVAKDGKTLRTYFLVADGRCNDGSYYNTSTDQRRERPVVVQADGSFTKAGNPRTRTMIHKGKRYRGRLSVSFSGTSSADGNTLTIAVRGSFRGKGLTCRTATTVVLQRDGTPGAPLAGPRVTTRTYPGATAPGFKLGSFSALAPGGELRGVNVRAPLKCPRSRPTPNRFSYKTLYLTAKDTIVVPTRTSGRSGGFRYVQTDVLTLRFFKRATGYGYSGSYRATVVFRKGSQVLRCKTPRTTFGATGVA